MKAAVFHAVAPRQIFQSIRDSWMQGLHKFDGKLGLVGNDNLRQECVETSVDTDAKSALKPKSVDTDAKSIIRDLCVLKDARTAPCTDRKTVPRHPSMCIAKEHSSMLTKIFSGGMQSKE